jgi:DNA-binding NtrC family response regulator
LECNILLIDSPADTNLLKETFSQITSPVKIQYTSSVPEALAAIAVSSPDLILIGSCILLVEGLQILNELSKVPIVVLSETDKFDRLLNDCSSRMYFITMPIEFEKIPGVIEEAYEFWTTCREGNQ